MPSSPSTALAKRSASTALTDPTTSTTGSNTNTNTELTTLLPPAKRIKRPAQALEEEEYEDAISHIIKRDFFPGLAESDAQREYLAALEAGDGEWIAEAGRRVTAARTPGPRSRDALEATPRRPGSLDGLRGVGGETPRGWVGDTPVSRAGGDDDGKDGKTREKGVDTELSLAEFQAKYTSEDNESFYKLLDRSNRKRTEKYSWLWANNKIPTARQLEWRKRVQNEQQERESIKAIDGGKELISVEYVDKRKAAPDTWKAKPNNTFMFAPDSIEDSMETIQQQKEAGSRMGPKKIIYENTRMLPPPRPASKTVPPSPSLSAVRDAIAGRPRLAGSELGSSDAGGGGETPRVNGYAFVDSEEPALENDHEWDPSASRIDLGPGDLTPNPFKIKEAGGREALHHRMVDRLNDKRQEKRHDVAQSPNRGGLTPAARRLLAKVGGSTPRASASLGDSWGDTPRSKPGLAGVTPARRN